MTTYWATFRIENETIDKKTYAERWNGMYEAVRTRCSRWWTEPTSFLVFESTSTIDQLATAVKGALAPSKDLFLIRQMDAASARIIGDVRKQDIFALMPYTKWV